MDKGLETDLLLQLMMINSMKINSLLKRGIGFAVVGLVSTLVNYGCFVVMYRLLQFHYILSSTIGYIIGLLLGYSLNKNWTFSRKTVVGKSYIFPYSVAQIAALFFCQALLFCLVEFLQMDPLLANIVALAFAALLSFLLIDIYVFKPINKIHKSNVR